MTSACAISCK